MNNGRPVFPWSVDAVLAQSNKVYPDPTGKTRFVAFSPESDFYNNFSWWVNSGNVEHLPSTSDSASLLAKFPQLGATVTPDATKVRQADVVQNVYGDYTALRDSGKLSADDKTRLEAYIALISQVQQAPPSTVCGKPLQETEVDLEARHRNQIRTVVAAMACDLTRVAAYTISTGYDPMHNDSHYPGEAEHSTIQVGVGNKVAFLLSQMDAIPDAGGGTLLDNSIVYFGNEFGENPGNGNAHIGANMPVVVAGGAAGKLQMGYYIDYRASGNRPMNNFLITLLNAMGLASSDYQQAGVVGFGEYNSTAANNYRLTQYLTNSERVKPLPFLYNGPTLG
jgi:hypothetical protein